MRKVYSFNYFRKNQDFLLKKLSFGSEVFRIISDRNFKFVRRFVDGANELVSIFEVKAGRLELKHRLVIQNGAYIKPACKCHNQCPYIIAFAIKEKLMNLPGAGLPITQWMYVDDTKAKKFRLVMKNKGFVWQYMDLYGSKFISLDDLEIPANFTFGLQKHLPSIHNKTRYSPKIDMIQKLISSGNKSWLNLKPFRSICIARRLRNDLALKQMPLF
jgi:hypothetical protein